MLKIVLLIALVLPLIQTGYSRSWKYCSDFDTESDDFGVTKFQAIPWNDNEVHLTLYGMLKTTIYPASISASGRTHLKPTLQIRIFKDSLSGQEIYSDIKDLNHYTNSSLLDGNVAVIKVPTVAGFDEKLKRGDNYVIQMFVVKRCGREVTCVEDYYSF